MVLLVAINQINVGRIGTLKPENNPSVIANGNTPKPGKFAFQQV